MNDAAVGMRFCMEMLIFVLIMNLSPNHFFLTAKNFLIFAS